MSSKTVGYLGIDVGTQGLSVVLTDEAMNVIATGDGHYEMVPGLAAGCYEQSPEDWEKATAAAMNDLRSKLGGDDVAFEVRGIGISGQMHGEVLTDDAGNPLAPARLWCDSRNDAEGEELTAALGVKMPKRITAARWLWTTRQRPELAEKVCHLTTPGGWLAFRLTGEWNLGVGDAAGMFPIDSQTGNYDARLLEQFEKICGGTYRPLSQLLPNVRRAGEDAGSLNEIGAKLLGLPIGIPVAPAEGDQPAAMAGSLIGSAGVVSMSFGTSVCANAVGDRPFQGVARSIDHFCAADGKPINMVWLRNGTTYMNAVVEMFGRFAESSEESPFARIMPLVLSAPDDCDGVLALPFMDDEPGLGVGQGGKGILWGINENNATPGNIVKAAILATMFNLRMGSQPLDAQGFPRQEIVLSGGLTKTPELGQLLSDVFNTPVMILESGQEGSAWGAALLAKYRAVVRDGQTLEWSEFLSQHAAGSRINFAPEAANVARLNLVYRSYCEMFESVIKGTK